MSTATKRGKLLPDLLVARDGTTQASAAHAGPLNGACPPADSETNPRSRPGILNWVLVRRADVLNAIEVALAGRAASPALARSEIGLTDTTGRVDRVIDRKRDTRAPAAAIFCEKGAAAPAALRPSCGTPSGLDETPSKSAACGRRAKPKARRTSP